MLYTELTRKAMITAYNAHHGQTDISGVPYIFHPFIVAEKTFLNGGGEYAVCAALLHDVAEDTEIGLEDLEKEFPQQVIRVLRLLTHEKGRSYKEYLHNIKNEEDVKVREMALLIKRADLSHNMEESRVAGVEGVSPEQMRHWHEKYKMAEEILNTASDK